MKKSTIPLIASAIFLLLALVVKITEWLPKGTIKTAMIFSFVCIIMYIIAKQKEKKLTNIYAEN